MNILPGGLVFRNLQDSSQNVFTLPKCAIFLRPPLLTGPLQGESFFDILLGQVQLKLNFQLDLITSDFVSIQILFRVQGAPNDGTRSCGYCGGAADSITRFL